MKIYRNNSAARILCEDRPNTIFSTLTMDKDGILYHHRRDGTSTSSDWDLIDVPNDHIIGEEFPECKCSNCQLADS